MFQRRQSWLSALYRLFVATLLIWLATTGWAPKIDAQDVSASSVTQSTVQSMALVTVARAYDRANLFDSAREAYTAAAVRWPAIADWLRLRAAGVTADSAARAADYATITNPVARARIGWTEAQARERTGDLAGAARDFTALGARLDALRDSIGALVADSDTVMRGPARAELLTVISNRSGTPDARAAADILDRLFAPLSMGEELIIARSAAATGPATRAAAGFDRVAAGPDAGALTPRDLYLYGTALERLHRDADAARVFADVAPHTHGTAATLVYAARYQQARMLATAGDDAAALRVLHALIREAGADSSGANARMLLADLATDKHNDVAARRAYLDVSRRFQRSPLAPRARFRAALLAFVDGASRRAALEWDDLVRRYPRSDDATAARYWSGRAWARGGKHSLADERWRAVLATDPLSYYAILSARRLQEPSPIASIALDTVQSPVAPAIDSAIARAAELESLGLAVEARFEVDGALADAGDTPTALATVGAALVQAGEAARAVSVGWHLAARDDSAWRDSRVLRLIYPLSFGDTLARDARARGLDPALIAAVVRQESAFNPRAVSVAGARGLMQIMPGVARGLARANGLTSTNADLLDEPNINLSLGVSHFATFLAQQRGDVIRTLAAYNAGPARVASWVGRRGVDDPEVFVERIPYGETRDYVRSIVRGREVYARLYGL